MADALRYCFAAKQKFTKAFVIFFLFHFKHLVVVGLYGEVDPLQFTPFIPFIFFFIFLTKLGPKKIIRVDFELLILKVKLWLRVQKEPIFN